MEWCTQTASLVVRLQDLVSGGEPMGRVRVFLNQEEVKTLAKPGGIFVFLDIIATGDQTVRVEGDHYLPVSRVVTLDGSPGLTAVIELLPNHAYPFSGNATLIRGQLRDSQGRAVCQAAFHVRTRPPGSQAVENIAGIAASGEFVVYLKSAALPVSTSKIFLELEVVNDYFNPETVLVEVREGSWCSAGIVTLQPK